jgi:hypothetical protein
MIALAVAALIAAAPFSVDVEKALSCGTFERQAHIYEPGCSGAVCTDANGRPVFLDEESIRSPGGAFKVHYTMKGPNGLLPVDQDGNGVPDYADRIAAAMDEALEAYRRLGFDDPMPDDGHGGDNRIDVYLSLLAGFGGVTYPDLDAYLSEPGPRPDRPSAVPAFLVINPVQHAAMGEILPDWMGDLLLRQVCAHELHHAVQMGYTWRGYGYGGNDEASWIYEGMSVMMEQSLLDLPHLFPFVTDLRYGVRYDYPNYSLLQPDVTRFGYANGLFFTSLLEDMGGVAKGFAAFWSSFALASGSNTENRMNTALQGAGLGTLRDAYRRFTLRALFLGSSDDGRHFKDGYRYHPADDGVRSESITASGSYTTVPLENYGNAYFRLENPGAGGIGLRKQAGLAGEWDWVQQFEDCSTSVTALDPLQTFAVLPTGKSTLRGWLVVRHFAAAPQTYFFEMTVPPAAPRSFTTALTVLDAPVTAAVGSVARLIALDTRSDCRREDVSDVAAWSFEPPGAAFESAGGAVTFLRPGPVTLQVAYGADVTGVSWNVEGPVIKPAMETGGCAAGGEAGLPEALALCGMAVFGVLRRVRMLARS